MRIAGIAIAATMFAACGEAAQDDQSGIDASSASGRHSAHDKSGMTVAQQAFAAANDRMHAAMADIPADADEAFMRGMLAHHRGALDMAKVELKHGKDAQARDLAQRVIDAQQAEIREMEAWLEKKGIDSAPALPAKGAVDHSAH